jgi:hypothetical protein
MHVIILGMKNKIIRVGFDFDGVIAYNPFRVARSFVSFIKKEIYGIKKLNFWYPEKKWQQIFWIIVHESSVFPSKGSGLLKKLTKEGIIEAHLITARYSFLDHSLNRWLKRFGLYKLFKTININKDNEQPHLFKQKMLAKYKLDYFIEDNWDIVNFLSKKPTTHNLPYYAKASRSKQPTTKIFWIYNLMDKGVEYPYKYPYLERALENIVESRIMNHLKIR